MLASTRHRSIQPLPGGNSTTCDHPVRITVAVVEVAARIEAVESPTLCARASQPTVTRSPDVRGSLTRRSAFPNRLLTASEPRKSSNHAKWIHGCAGS
jgi:hypothetical protein